MKRQMIRGTVFLFCLFLYLYGTTDTFQTAYPPVASPFLCLVRFFGGSLTFSVIIVPLLITLVLLVRKRFFCRYLCPLGVLFDLIRWMKSILFRLKNLSGLDFGTPFLLRFPWLGTMIVLLVCGAALFRLPMITRFLILDPLVLFSGVFSPFLFPRYLFLFLVLLAFFVPWFWCSTFCPLGALQEILYRVGNIGKYCLKFQEKSSRELNQAIPQVKVNSVPIKRRYFLTTFAYSLASIVFVIPLTTIRTLFQDRFLPPGARDEPEFSTLCSSCGRCILSCPTKHLVPFHQEVVYNEEEQGSSTHSYKIPGALPMVDTQSSWCEKDCIACGQVCPTGAIQPFDQNEKKDLKVGLAEYCFDHCVLYMEKDCNICIRECPWNALELVWSEEFSINIPMVNAQKCTGCGRCVVKCPGFDPIYHGAEDETIALSPPKAFTIKKINGD